MCPLPVEEFLVASAQVVLPADGLVCIQIHVVVRMERIEAPDLVVVGIAEEDNLDDDGVV